jgi:hypothetical protein
MPNRHTCDECGKSFKSKKSLYNHTRRNLHSKAMKTKSGEMMLDESDDEEKKPKAEAGKKHPIDKKAATKKLLLAKKMKQSNIGDLDSENSEPNTTVPA